MFAYYKSSLTIVPHILAKYTRTRDNIFLHPAIKVMQIEALKPKESNVMYSYAKSLII